MAKTKKFKSIKNIKSIKNNKKTIKKNKKVKQLIIKKKLMTDEEIKDKESEYFSKKDFKHIIKRDLDVYYLKDGKKVLLAKFRKKVIPKKLCKLVIDNLKEAAKKEHDNRGPAAGPIDFKKVPQYVKKENVKEQGKYRIYGYYSDTTHKLVNNYIGNKAQSNIIGYFDRPDRNTNTINQPCRLTAFNANKPEKFKNVIPYIRAADRVFKDLVPAHYKKQYQRAQQTKFVIADTAFSTLTINYNWRTGLHKDSGDYIDGFGNLLVCEEGKYEGGFTGFPQYGVCFDVREGDFLAMDVHESHCNTEIKGKTKDYTRLSVVCYLRNNMIKCKDN